MAHLNDLYRLLEDNEENINHSDFSKHLINLHIKNSFTNFDKRTNNEYEEYGQYYTKRFTDFSNEKMYLDDLDNYYNYIKYHLDNIMKNIKSKLIRIDCKVDKNKVKNFDIKTIRKISLLPGNTIREKLSMQKTISTTKKVFTHNTKENQVVAAFVKEFLILLKYKKTALIANANIFDTDFKTINEQIKYMKYYNTFLEDLGIDPVRHITKNNTLLNNVHYASVTACLKKLKKLANIDQVSINKTFKKNIQILIKMMMLKNLEVIDKKSTLSSFNNDFFYKDDKEIVKYVLNVNDNLLISKFIYQFENQYNYKNKEEFEVNITTLDNVFTVSINNNEKNFNYNLIDLKKMLDFVYDIIQIKQSLKLTKSNDITNSPYFSLSSYDNTISSNESDFLSIFSTDTKLLKNPNNLFYSTNNISLGSFLGNRDNYFNMLSAIKNNIKTSDYIIYDIKDSIDAFTTAELRRDMSSVFYKSYPVWRSILAVESIPNNKDIRKIIDLTGKNSTCSLVKIKTSDNKFIHLGSNNEKIDFSEKSFLNKYLEYFSKKIDINLTNDIQDRLINIGLVNYVLTNKDKKYTIIDENFITIWFDKECFEDTIDFFEQEFYYINPNINTLVVVPDFLYDHVDFQNKVKNSDLRIGAEVIRQRLINNEICWWENLPELSLEIIKNGMFDEIKITNSNEVENMIGKKIELDIRTTFIIPKNLKEIKLRLNKAFTNEENLNISALIKLDYPFDKDVNCKLKLTFDYASPNSYNLKFVPSDGSKDIIVQWQEDNITSEIDKIEIPDFTISKGKIEKDIEYLKLNMVPMFNYILNNEKPKKSIDPFKLANMYQELKIVNKSFDLKSIIALNSDKYIEKLINVTIESEKFLIDQLIGSVIFEPIKLIRENFFSNPLQSYPRILANTAIDDDAFNYVFNEYLEKYILDKKRSNSLERFKAVTKINHHLIKKMLNHNESKFIQFLSSFMVDFEQKIDLFQKNIEKMKIYDYKQTTMFVASTIDILLATLSYTNDFEKLNYFLNPNKEYVQKMIKLYKKFNSLYQSSISRYRKNAMNEGKREKFCDLKSEYKFNFKGSVNKDLHKVENIIYYIILFLSRDEIANTIKIEGYE